MDLALEFGLPVGTLSRLMTERELRSWQRYSVQKMLPTQRVVMQLAHVAQWIAAGASESPKHLGDFIVTPSPENDDNPTIDEWGD